jgi:hypothetical protein
MLRLLNRPRRKRLYEGRGQAVAPIPGLAKEIVGLEHCGMGGHWHNRWLFAAMGVAAQLHRAQARQEKRAT